MKVLRISVAVLAVGLLVLLAYALSNAIYTERPVGLQVVGVPHGGARPMAVAIWYPTEARPMPTTLLGFNLISVAKNAPVAGDRLPIVLISHGNGGGPGSHVDLALALAEQGYVVVAPTHTGDNFADSSAVGTGNWLPDRTQQLRAALDYVLEGWPARERLDARRIGVFGFSAGGFTALAAAGGQPDLRRVASHCAGTSEFVCRMLGASRSPLLDVADQRPPGVFVRDRRIRAVVLAAPGLGFTFVPGGLDGVEVPVQVWAGGADDHVPGASNVRPIVEALGARAELHEIAAAGHFAFLAPCGLFGPPALCGDGGGVDRVALHRRMNEAIVAFFKRTL